MVRTCPRCDLAGEDADHYCEACGSDLRPPPRWLTSAAPSGRCGHCDAAAVRPGGYCDECGHRRSASRDRAEVELPGLAAVTDRGHRKHHNEDAVAIGAHLDGIAAIVCDGVSTSPRADTAAQAAVDVGLPELLAALAEGTPALKATDAAYRRAFAAVAQLAAPELPTAPSCTYVSGMITASGITIGWVGDSRAYWVPASGAPRCLTVDDALPEASGAPLTRWVGADAVDIGIQLITVESTVAGSLVLCSDGLSTYLAGPADLAVVAGSPPATAARHLTQLALDSGGADNIAVAVLSFTVPPQRGAPV